MRAQRRSREGRGGGWSRVTVTAAAMGMVLVVSVASADTTGAVAEEDRPTIRSEVWSGAGPGRHLHPEVAFTPLSPGELGLEDITWELPVGPVQADAPPMTEPIAVPLPTAGWAGIALLMLMGLWRSRTLRRMSHLGE